MAQRRFHVSANVPQLQTSIKSLIYSSHRRNNDVHDDDRKRRERGSGVLDDEASTKDNIN